MRTPGFALFEVPIGSCAVAWGERGIIGLQLPEATKSATRTRMKKRFPGAVEAPPPRNVGLAIGRMQALLRGRDVDLSSIVLDMEGVSPFTRRVYETARKIPAGSTLSYGEVARKLGAPKSARAVGQALGRNPFPIVVPCHRVLASGGKAGGFTAEGGVETKLRLLELEKPPAKPAGAKPRKLPAAARDPQSAAAKVPIDLARAVRDLRAADPALARVIDEVGPCRLQLRGTSSVFHALSEAIVYQQLTDKAAATIHGRVCALFPRAKNGYSPKHILAARDADLRGAGLSRAKAAALQDLARKVSSRAVPTIAQAAAMSDDELLEQLTAVRGIGRWTVEMLLMFRLGRPDVLPADDYGVRKGFAVTYRKRDLPSRTDLLRHGERWKPWRSVASWYLWRAAEKAPRRKASK